MCDFPTDVFPTLPAPATGQLGEREKLAEDGFVHPPGSVSALEYCGIGGGSSTYDSKSSVQDLRPTGNTSDGVSEFLDQLR